MSSGVIPTLSEAKGQDDDGLARDDDGRRYFFVSTTSSRFDQLFVRNAFG